eukprot:TRINITY_DN11485_c0_g1_i2.p1 TRINITY_DN11485_c0_g1~~TRINITY_DN11485_c0_g1_i2.p1  ORF type:complete len:522 (-),score=103.71 TRINITY_DN11485_c0_g1_i2:146-1711(-)
MTTRLGDYSRKVPGTERSSSLTLAPQPVPMRSFSTRQPTLLNESSNSILKQKSLMVPAGMGDRDTATTLKNILGNRKVFISDVRSGQNLVADQSEMSRKVGQRSIFLNYMHRENNEVDRDLEKKWIDKRNKDLAERRTEQEFVGLMKDWSRAKARLEEEISRRHESGYAGSAFRKVAFRPKATPQMIADYRRRIMNDEVNQSMNLPSAHTNAKKKTQHEIMKRNSTVLGALHANEDEEDSDEEEGEDDDEEEEDEDDDEEDDDEEDEEDENGSRENNVGDISAIRGTREDPDDSRVIRSLVNGMQKKKKNRRKENGKGDKSEIAVNEKEKRRSLSMGPKIYANNADYTLPTTKLLPSRPDISVMGLERKVQKKRISEVRKLHGGIIKAVSDPSDEEEGVENANDQTGISGLNDVSSLSVYARKDRPQVYKPFSLNFGIVQNGLIRNEQLREIDLIKQKFANARVPIPMSRLTKALLVPDGVTYGNVPPIFMPGERLMENPTLLKKPKKKKGKKKSKKKSKK